MVGEGILVVALELGEALGGVDLDREGGSRPQQHTLSGVFGDELAARLQAEALAQLLGQGESPAFVDSNHLCHEFSISHLMNCCKRGSLDPIIWRASLPASRVFETLLLSAANRHRTLAQVNQMGGTPVPLFSEPIIDKKVERHSKRHSGHVLTFNN